MQRATDESPHKPRILSLKELPKEFKVELLKELGFKVEGTKILTATGDRYTDPFSGAEVSIDSMVILPGRSPPLVLDDSPLSLTWYIEEYGDIF